MAGYTLPVSEEPHPECQWKKCASCSACASAGSPRESILDQAHAQIFPDEEDEGSNVAVAGSRVATN